MLLSITAYLHSNMGPFSSTIYVTKENIPFIHVYSTLYINMHVLTPPNSESTSHSVINIIQGNRKKLNLKRTFGEKRNWIMMITTIFWQYTCSTCISRFDYFKILSTNKLIWTEQYHFIKSNILTNLNICAWNNHDHLVCQYIVYPDRVAG